MMLSVHILHTVNTICQEVLPSQFDTSREVINFLVLGQALEESVFERLSCPHEEPAVTGRSQLVRQILILVLKLAEAVIFESVLDEFDLEA